MQCRLLRQSEDAEESPAGRVAYGSTLDPDYVEVLKTDSLQWLEVLLHMADISTPLKPFWISKQWAWRVLDEFFAQGDEEKKLGIPVGMLNDRDKVNRPGSQHGFINFLVAPLVTNTVRLFPTMQDLHTQMGLNLESWCEVWKKDCNPSAE